MERTAASPEAQRASPMVFTVSQLTGRIRDLLEREVGSVWVEGEVSRPVLPASGHLYLTLKDSASQIKAVIFKNRLRYLAFRPEDGVQVLAFGRLTVYEPRGEYQLVVDHLEPLGTGALALAFEQLKKKLAAEGLFDQDRKKPLPVLPRRVAVVTSTSGAALWDFLKIIHRRHPGLHILVYPVLVQGEAAPGMISQALLDLNRLDPPPEVIVVGRGGGSLEDLWAFNTEVVARAIAGSKVPVISAVGHEVDYTIADFTADLRASTPSAAAELLIRPREEWLAELEGLSSRLSQALGAGLASWRARAQGASKRLLDPRRMIERWLVRTAGDTDRLGLAVERTYALSLARTRAAAGRLTAQSPDRRMGHLRERLSRLERGLALCLAGRLEGERARAGALAERLAGLSPLAVLSRGYSLTQRADGRVVRSAGMVEPGDRVRVRLGRGELGCLVEEVLAGGPPEGGSGPS